MERRGFELGAQASDSDVNIEETKASRVISENNRRHYEDFMENQSEVNEVNSNDNSDYIKVTEKPKQWSNKRIKEKSKLISSENRAKENKLVIQPANKIQFEVCLEASQESTPWLADHKRRGMTSFNSKTKLADDYSLR